MADRNVLDPSGAANGWVEYRALVLAELQRLADAVVRVEARLAAIEAELGPMKVKSGIWGAIAGFIPLAVLLILYLVLK